MSELYIPLCQCGKTEWLPFNCPKCGELICYDCAAGKGCKHCVRHFRCPHCGEQFIDRDLITKNEGISRKDFCKRLLKQMEKELRRMKEENVKKNTVIEDGMGGVWSKIYPKATEEIKRIENEIDKLKNSIKNNLI